VQKVFIFIRRYLYTLF